MGVSAFSTEVSKSNEEEENKEQAEEKHKVKKKLALPPEYDENDSRWTLKYREPAEGLVELIEYSGVYVNAETLAKCESLSSDSNGLAQLLLTEIFTIRALDTCTWSGTNADVGYGTPHLDERATNTLLKFVKEYTQTHGWESTDCHSIVKNLCQIMLQMRQKRLALPPGHDPNVQTNEKASKSNEEKTNEEQAEEKHKVKKKLALPPEYDENDSRWTLKYREPAEGLVELIEYSGVYVNAETLAKCESLSSDSNGLAQLLLTEIFTIRALDTCTWSGRNADGGHGITQLDEHATNTLLKFVKEYAQTHGWESTDCHCIVKNLCQIMLQMRQKRLALPPGHDPNVQTNEKVSKSNEEKTNEEQAEEKHKVKKKLALPPEYDENDSRWTLKYRELAEGLVELIEHSGVYVNADKLAKCKSLSNDSNGLAQLLLTEIFTISALCTCTWSGTNAESGHATPQLDECATNTLLKFVKEYAQTHGWEITDCRYIVNNLRQIMLQMRQKRLAPPPGYDPDVQTNEKVSKPNEEKTNEEQAKEKHEVKKKLALPPEYDENDSRWTLKYREPAQGLIELIEYSGVYVHAETLAKCESLSSDSNGLAQLLLTEIFTISALGTCTWSGTNADGAHTTPQLDERATNTLLKFVKEYAQTHSWELMDCHCIVKNLRQIMLQLRQKILALPPGYDPNDSRWTLKYREPAEGLVELMENSHVYINADKLAVCMQLSNDRVTLARMLLSEIFTASALSTCSVTDPPSQMRVDTATKDTMQSVTNFKLVLDEHAMSILLLFTFQYGECRNWRMEIDEERRIQESICQKMKVMRRVERKTAGDTNRDKILKKYCTFEHTSLPPEYDENDSRWTLKYREPAPGLVELLEHSGVYVNADKLAECKEVSKDCVTLAQKLLTEVFTASALGTCCLSMKNDECYNFHRYLWYYRPKPELDAHAEIILLNFVDEYGLEQGWPVLDFQCIRNGIYDILRDMEQQYLRPQAEDAKLDELTVAEE